MSKADVLEVMPEAPPRKRRLLEAAPALWLAVWLDSELSPSDRRRLEAEKARRKALVREHRVGLVVAPEGPTPVQLAAMIETLEQSGASEIHHGGVPSKLHNAARAIGVVHHQEAWPFSDERIKAVIRASDAIVAAPKEQSVLPYATPGVWNWIGYAKNRGLPVRIILPNGRVEE